MNRCIGIGLFIIITKFTHFLDFIDDVKHFKTSGVWQKGFLGLENNLDIYYPTAANNPSFRGCTKSRSCRGIRGCGGF